MASTNETPILKLPQFTSEDKPAWIGDFNSAMQKIDTGVGDNQGKIASVETVANEAKATADSANAAVTALGSEVSRVATEQDAQASEIDSLQSDVENLQQTAGEYKKFEPASFQPFTSSGELSTNIQGMLGAFRKVTIGNNSNCTEFSLRISGVVGYRPLGTYGGRYYYQIGIRRDNVIDSPSIPNQRDYGFLVYRNSTGQINIGNVYGCYNPTFGQTALILVSNVQLVEGNTINGGFINMILSSNQGQLNQNIVDNIYWDEG